MTNPALSEPIGPLEGRAITSEHWRFLTRHLFYLQVHEPDQREEALTQFCKTFKLHKGMVEAMLRTWAPSL